MGQPAPSPTDERPADAGQPARSRVTWTAGVRGWFWAVAPGVGAAVVIAMVATVLGDLAPVVGAPVIAIVGGIAVSVVHRPPARLQPGIAFTSKKVLQGSIVVLGTGLSLGQVLTTGVDSLPVLLGTLLVALGAAWLVGRALRLRGDLVTLIGVGTAICGASAIAATDAVIDADEADVSYAIAAIFTCNAVAVLTFPSLGHALGLSQRTFGLWSGTAINDLSSVVAASTVYGHVAASYAVVVKLTRTLAIIPISLGLAVVRGWRREATVRKSRVALHRVFPTFIALFVAAVAANTAGMIPSSWHQGLSDAATWMITAALAAIGLSTNVGHIRRAGSRPLALGVILWVTVALASLGLQALTGSL